MSQTSQGQQDAWTIAKLLGSMQSYFHSRRMDSPRLDAEVLLSFVLGRDRMYLYTHFDQPLTDVERTALRELTRRRGQGEPVAYLTGSREFYGRDFSVNAHVLIPRPETEHVIDSVLAWVRHTGAQAPRICDVGTGSGAIGLTLACEIPGAQVVLTDVSAEALTVAQTNAQALGVADRITCVHADLFTPMTQAPQKLALDEPFDIVVSNPPYIAEGDMASLPRDVGLYEPRLALSAGPEGLDCLQGLCKALATKLCPSAFVALEMGEGQGRAVRAALGAVLPHIDSAFDLAGIERVVAGWHDASFTLGAPSPFAGLGHVKVAEVQGEEGGSEQEAVDDPMGYQRD